MASDPYPSPQAPVLPDTAVVPTAYQPQVGSKTGAVTAIVRQGFIPIFVDDTLNSERFVEESLAAGCQVLEYSCRRPDARQMIPWIKRNYPETIVLAATLLDSPGVSAHLARTIPGFLTIEEAVDLGADGLISFLRFRPETYERYGDRLVMVAGVGSPNEALEQLELGADLIKVTVGSTSGSDLVTKTWPAISLETAGAPSRRRSRAHRAVMKSVPETRSTKRFGSPIPLPRVPGTSASKSSARITGP